MGSSREESPDWLRSFQAPIRSVTTLSSDSEPLGDKSPTRDGSIDLASNTKHRSSHLLERDEQDESISDIAITSDVSKSSNKKTKRKRVKVDDEISAKRSKTGKHKKRESDDDKDVQKGASSDKQVGTPAPNHLVWDLSSDSESNLDAAMREKEANEEPSAHESSELLSKEEKIDNEEFEEKVAGKGKSPAKLLKTKNVKSKEKKKVTDQVKIEGEVGDVGVAEEGIREKDVEPCVTSSTLPLVLPEKVYRSKALVECEGESIDLSGDMGAVGRVIISETPSGEPEMLLDLKGTIYKTTIVPSRTFCVVSIGQSEAKIEAIMNDFIQLKPQSNVYDAETMVEGTLEGFSFDSEDEADKKAKDVENDKNEDAQEQPDGKTKGKAQKKRVAPKKGKATGGKQPKKRKPQAPKKNMTKK